MYLLLKQVIIGSQQTTKIQHTLCLLTNYLSFIPTRYNLGLAKILVDWLYKINNTWSGFYNVMERTKLILQKNLFPPELTGKVVKNYLSDQYNSKESLNKKEGHYFKLPYLGFFSRHTHNKIKRIIKKLCKDVIYLQLSTYLPSFTYQYKRTPKNR